MANWGEINLDDVDTLIKEVEEYGTTKKLNSKSSGESPRQGNEGKGKTLDVQANNEDEESDELENESEEGEEELEDEESEDTTDDESEDDVEDTSSDGNSGGDAERARLLEELENTKRQVQAALAERDEARTSIASKEKDIGALRASQLKTQRDSLELETKGLISQIKAAKTDGDSDLEEELRVKLQEKTLRKLAVETAIEEATSETETVKEPVKKQAAPGANPDVPTEAVNFVTRNAWINNASQAVRNTVAAQAQILIDAGKDPATQGFYDELEKRLERALEGTNHKVVPRVKPQVKSKGSPVAAKDSATEKDSRTKVIKQKGGKSKVIVTKADIQAANNLGMEPKDYIKAKIKTERQNGGNAANWATIEV